MRADHPGIHGVVKRKNDNKPGLTEQMKALTESLFAEAVHMDCSVVKIVVPPWVYRDLSAYCEGKPITLYWIKMFCNPNYPDNVCRVEDTENGRAVFVEAC